MIWQIAMILRLATAATNPFSESMSAASACSLISTSALEKIVGEKMEAKPNAYSLPGGNGSTCTFQGGQIQLMLFSGAGSTKRFQDYLSNSLLRASKTGAPDVTKHPVSGIGSSAYYMNPKPPVALLVVSSGSSTLGISMVAHYGVKAESLKPKLIAIAKSAMPGLR